MNRKYAIPNDYNIYCALSTGKVPETILRKLFLNRGIIVSPKTTRENLANYFASLMQGYNDYQDISLQHQKLERSEYISSKEISSELNLLDLGNSLNNLKDKLDIKISNTELKDVKTSIFGDSLAIEFEYEKFYPEKQMFSQIEQKRGLLTFKKSEEGKFYIEHPSTNEMLEWSDSIIDLLENEDENINIQEIDLSGITNPEDYWSFFNELTESFGSYERRNVVEILFKDISKGGETEDSEEYQLISASYRGNQLHLSDDFKQKFNDGYKLYKFTWDCVDKSISEPDKYRLSIKIFYNKEGRNNFSFITRGLYKNKDGIYNKSLQSLSNAEEEKFNRLVFAKGLELLNNLENQTGLQAKIETDE
ncbi:hypothetical protein HG533_07310 [Moraxella osloensis]|nr:hypothetical protein [Moraxella osloensis]MBW4018609.1 hypothetical protein [Moraxella osloensis]